MLNIKRTPSEIRQISASQTVLRTLDPHVLRDETGLQKCLNFVLDMVLTRLFRRLPAGVISAIQTDAQSLAGRDDFVCARLQQGFVIGETGFESQFLQNGRPKWVLAV